MTIMKKLFICSTMLLLASGMFAQTEVTPSQKSSDTGTNPTSVTVVIPSSEVPVMPKKEYYWKDNRHNISFSVGLPGLYSTLTYGHSWAFYIAPPSASGSSGATKRDVFCGAWEVDYQYQVLRWLRVGASVGYEYWAGNTRTHDIFAAAKVDFTYINREYIRLYSGIGMGLAMHVEQYSNGGAAGRYLPACTLTPIGLNLGNRNVYGLIETNIGAASCLRVGIGFRP